VKQNVSPKLFWKNHKINSATHSAANLEDLMMVATKINISSLQEFVLTKVSRDAPLYSVMICEPEDMELAEFLIHVKLWLKLCRGKLT
jgi:hypothetical protein